MGFGLMTVLVGLGGAIGFAQEQEKSPSVPFSVYVFAKGELAENQPPDGKKLPYSEKKLVDSAGDVRGAIEKNHQAWFRLVDSREEAEIVLEITNRGQSSESALYDSAVQELAGHAKVLSSYDGPIKFTFKSGAGVGWRNIANRLVGVLRDHCERKLVSLEDERVRLEQASALQVELEALQALEGSAAETFGGLADQLKAGTIEAEVAARTIEEEIVGPMARIRERMTTLKDDATALQARSTMLRLIAYMKLREEAWTLAAEAVRENDGAKSQLASKKHQQAKAVLDKVTKRQP